MATLLITGGAGFIGSNFVRMAAGSLGKTASPDLAGYRIVVVDKLTYAGNLASIQPLIDAGQIDFVKADICDAAAMAQTWEKYAVTHVVHFAAESHVDRSILSSGPFVQTNVVGTQILLDVSRARGVKKFVHVSTDEVYGTLPEDQPELKFTEETPIATNSPYSASKAGSDLLVRAYYHTHGFPACITRCSNNYGPYQFPEKLIPLFITNLMEDKQVPLYGDGKNVRDWLHVEDHCTAIWRVLTAGKVGEVYNIGGNNELPNHQITRIILDAMGKPWDKYVRYVQDRPGHDRRYAIDAGKMLRELGWSPAWTFETGIAATIDWYKANTSWWKPLKKG
jgi:dTDP-glucose 4,6-dehydratase